MPVPESLATAPIFIEFMECDLATSNTAEDSTLWTILQSQASGLKALDRMNVASACLGLMTETGAPSQRGNSFQGVGTSCFGLLKISHCHLSHRQSFLGRFPPQYDVGIL